MGKTIAIVIATIAEIGASELEGIKARVPNIAVIIKSAAMMEFRRIFLS